MQGYFYERYMPTDNETRWATDSEIKNAASFVDLFEQTYPAAGLPLISDGKRAYVDNEDNHSLIFGTTGSKKTRLFCMPMLNMFIRAGESFVATDPKGELYQRSAGFARKNGYKVTVLNFRDIGNGDTWNPLAMPYKLYNCGKKEKAVSILNDFVATISADQRAKTADSFWPEMASSYALANLLLLMECATEKEANVQSLAALCTGDSVEMLKDLSEKMSKETIAGMNYKNVLTSPEKTLNSILVSLYAMIRIFSTQKELCKMLSNNSIDIASFGRQKTAVFLIIPDEKTTYHFLITTFIKQAYEQLISEAQNHPANMLPVRVNFVMDEFCNLPKIPDMPSMISAARSRNMRFFLIVQSLHQLKGKYGEDADTIKGNCTNWVFLTSRELDLLNEISSLCGTYTTADNRIRSLISISELQRLNKNKGEALIMHNRLYPFISQLADIDDYEMFKGFPAPDLGNIHTPDVQLFSLQKLYEQVRKGRRVPFSDSGFLSGLSSYKLKL